MAKLRLCSEMCLAMTSRRLARIRSSLTLSSLKLSLDKSREVLTTLKDGHQGLHESRSTLYAEPCERKLRIHCRTSVLVLCMSLDRRSTINPTLQARCTSDDSERDGEPRFCAQMRLIRSAICWTLGERVIVASWTASLLPGGSARCQPGK